MLEFTINKQILKRVDDYDLVTDSLNYVTATFNFCDDWSGSVKRAIFKDYTGAYEVELDENNTCVVPAEVLRRCEKDCKKFEVSVYGESGFTRITTNGVIVKVRLSGYTDDAEDSYLTHLIKIEQAVNGVEGETVLDKVTTAVNGYREYQAIPNARGGDF